MKKALILTLSILSILITVIYAESGTINLVYANGSTSYVGDKIYYEFDVQAWMSNGSDVIGDGMVYIGYPNDIFGDIVVINQKINVNKTGILDGVDPLLNIDLYNIVNITDTKLDVFAITFMANFNGANPNFKVYYSPISADALNPSDLLHVCIEASAGGQGNVLFPGFIPDTDLLYFDYEGELFSNGLQIAEAIEPVDVALTITPPDDTIPPEIITPPDDPSQVGIVELASFSGSLKKSAVLLKWVTLNETDNAGFIIKRSETGGQFVEITSYLKNATLEGDTASTKRIRYSYTDFEIVPGKQYTYQLESIDIYGNATMHKTIYIDANSVALNRKKVMGSEDFSLEASYPNPFNPSFVVPFNLTSSQYIDIKLYDMSGQLVRNIAGNHYQAGQYNIHVNCSNLGSAVYLLKTNIDGQQSTQKMLLVK
ncbi:MAG: T9SS type A sorting domain-containing protein [Candidatus Marinimicrobia bacterium]|nr:T9SS type A sorting domain-containing protein [Candidatus Neomarinimicrobiota bacterium]